MYREFKQRSFAPVNVGDELELKIEAVGEKGDGIAKIKGFVIFVPNTKEGDVVKVKITKVLRKVGFGEVVGQVSGEVSGEKSPKKKSKKVKEEKTEEFPESEETEEVSDSENFGE